jgi:hypothetical protein
VSQKHHLRTVEIRTITATCDECLAVGGPAAHATLLGWGWRLMKRGDVCPDCSQKAAEIERRTEEDAARARRIASLDGSSDEPSFVRGRVLLGEDGHALYTRAEINAEITRALRARSSS